MHPPFRSAQAIGLFLILITTAAAYAQTSIKVFAPTAVSTEGKIRVPEDFRSEYVMLGAWSVTGDVDTEGEIGQHIVYAPRSAVEGYRKTGAFPDGTILVKELFNSQTEELTTGAATSPTTVAGYFIMVRDEQDRFPENPLWGDGWGWSFFTADNKTETITENYQDSCLGCHEPARASNLIYDYAYPVLRE
ncbi:cytochrome P460 family protein [Kiloniella laminariae]|uniref:cytochrome P460 family protein n=1 Tax=Kiloniella laminariae TaxID=454162 RepID=UPI00035C61CC|nr:cytochrome P460 family protein [Kiloniella laminariae]